MARVQLVRVAHARSGDKGDTANVGVIALKPEYYPVLVQQVTAERVKTHFDGICYGRVERFELPNLGALNFLLHESLDGGGTLSLKADAQGKTYSAALLRMEIDISMGSYQKILYQAENGIARITLNRPEKRNALDAELLGELRDAISTSAQDQSVRLVLLTGAGPDFCSGADLAALQRSSESGVLENMADARVMAGLFLQMRYHPRPIVAAVRGRALAGGCGLATACDAILASESARFGYPEVNIGFVPAMVMALLRRSVSEKRAFELITMGEVISAQTAFDIGLINRVFSDETFDIEVDAYASKLAAKPASAVTLSKNLLYHMDALPFEAAIESGVHMNSIARTTEDCKSGIKLFSEEELDWYQPTMDAAIQTAVAVGVPTLAVMLGVLINNSRLSDLRSHFDKRWDDTKDTISDMRSHFDNRFDDMKDTWRAELRRVEEVIDARLKHLEENQ